MPVGFLVSVQVRPMHNETLLICSTYFLHQTQPHSLSALRYWSSSLRLGSCPASPLRSSGRWDAGGRGKRDAHSLLSDSRPPNSPSRLSLPTGRHSTSDQRKVPHPGTDVTSIPLLRSQERQAGSCPLSASAESSSSCAPGHRTCWIPWLPTARTPELPGSHL